MIELVDRRDLEPWHADKSLCETDTVAHINADTQSRDPAEPHSPLRREEPDFPMRAAKRCCLGLWIRQLGARCSVSVVSSPK